MKKTKLLLMMILFVMGAKSTFGQTMGSSVIASSGGFDSRLSYTVGEMTMIGTTSAFGNYVLSQGFQQPWANTGGGTNPWGTVGISESYLADAEINVFPNPASDQLSLSIRSDKNSAYRISITDVLGKQISSFSYTSSAINRVYNYDVSTLDAGIYLLTIQSADNNYTKTIRFNKN